MAGKGTELQRTLLNYIFCTSATSAAGGAASGPGGAATSTTTLLYVSLHTADPGNAGTQATNEVAYTGYTRIATQRTASAGVGGWTISAAFSPCSVYPTTGVTFPQCTTASTLIITNWAVGTASSAATQGTTFLYYCGTVTPNISLGANVTPSLTTGSACTED